MGKLQGVLLVSDYDDTLVYTKPAFTEGAEVPRLSPRNREALQRFAAEGGTFAVATGRALPSFLAVAEDLPFNAPCIIANGGGIYDVKQRTYLHKAFLPENIYGYCHDFLQAFPAVGLEVYHPDSVIHAMNPNRFIRQHQHMTHTRGTVAERIEEIPLPFVKIVFEDEHDTLEQLRQFLLAQPWIGRFEVLFSGWNFLELTACGANKGAAVRRLAQLLGIADEDIYCVGDQNNDASMLAVSAIPFAPGNCVETLRTVPRLQLLPDCREDAVAALVEVLEKRYDNR